jgi:hypothetical protein
MVRNEADIVSTMIDHHLEQGVDVFIVTDNGSIDGTTAILQGYADRGLIELRHDPVHRKQQGSVVTEMARDAATRHHADWVVNADADEFFLAVDRSKTLKQALEAMPIEYRSFIVPVVNLTGAPAAEGSGLQRLIYRDERPQHELTAAGIIAHPTPDSVHVGDPDVVVAQGNHQVSLESLGEPEGDDAIEVLHLPWRSWTQYRDKVEISGRAYEANPELRPSPNHHGMRDYARLHEGTLLAYYLLRHPNAAELEAGLASGSFVEDRVLADHLPSAVADRLFSDELMDAYNAFSPIVREQSLAMSSLSESTEMELVVRENRMLELEVELEHLRADRDALALESAERARVADALQLELDEVRNRRIVRLTESLKHGRLG